MRRCRLKGMLLLFSLWARIAAGQQADTASGSDRELVKQLLERVQQLEAEVKELKAQHAAAVSSAPQPAPTPASSEAQPAKPKAEAADGQTAMSMPDVLAQGSPRMQFRGFSDVYYSATDREGSTNSFGLGQFTLFITSRLSDRLSVLAEAVLEADTNNAFGFELERLLLQYAASDYFNVSFGRYHTAIGWYNTAYHHSTWMQTAVGRPFLFEFEDKGGILPVHNVGISASGRIPSGSLGLRYVAEVGNGRSSRSPMGEPVQNVLDENNGKSVNFAIMTRPDRWRGFQAGFSVYHDRLTPVGTPKLDQTILAAHVVYQGSSFEWLNEGLVVRNAVDGTSQVAHTPGFYTQISQKFSAVRPYFRYQYVNVPESDMMFHDVGLMYGPSVGIRWDFSEFAAFKLQYDRTDRRRLSGFNGITTQLSFTF